MTLITLQEHSADQLPNTTW